MGTKEKNEGRKIKIKYLFALKNIFISKIEGDSFQNFKNENNNGIYNTIINSNENIKSSENLAEYFPTKQELNCVPNNFQTSPNYNIYQSGIEFISEFEILFEIFKILKKIWVNNQQANHLLIICL